MRFPVDKYEGLVTRILSGEVVFFVGAGFSVDSEGNSAGRLIARLMTRFAAMAEVVKLAGAQIEDLQDGLRLTFSFPSSTAAASFRRGDTVWLLFDSAAPLEVEPIRAKGGAIVGEVTRELLDAGQAIRITDAVDTSLVAPRERKYEQAGAASAAATGKVEGRQKTASA